MLPKLIRVCASGLLTYALTMLIAAAYRVSHRGAGYAMLAGIAVSALVLAWELRRD